MKNLSYTKERNLVVFSVAHSNKVGIARSTRCDGCEEIKPCYLIDSFAPTICPDCLKEMFGLAAAHFEPGPSRPPEENLEIKVKALTVRVEVLENEKERMRECCTCSGTGGITSGNGYPDLCPSCAGSGKRIKA